MDGGGCLFVIVGSSVRRCIAVADRGGRVFGCNAIGVVSGRGCRGSKKKNRMFVSWYSRPGCSLVVP